MEVELQEELEGKGETVEIEHKEGKVIETLGTESVTSKQVEEMGIDRTKLDVEKVGNASM